MSKGSWTERPRPSGLRGLRILWRVLLCRAGMRFLVPADVRRVLGRLVDAGYEAHLVGGCVRDLLIGRRPVDWDVTTDARPEEVLGLFAAARRSGYRYGTVGLGHVQVTTYRTDGRYSDHRHPDAVSFAADLVSDLARRDFTVNAMALTPAGALFDPFGGRHALVARRLRAVGEPSQRFAEDALRMLRAMRLAAELRFVPEPGLLFAIQRRRRLLHHVAAERVRDEIGRTLCAPGAGDGLELMRRAGVLGIVIPELVPLARGDRWTAVLEQVGAAPRELCLRLAALFAPLGAGPARGFLGRLRFDRRTERDVVALIEGAVALEKASQDADLRRLVHAIGRTTAARLGRWLRGEPHGGRLLQLLSQEDVYDVHDLAVNGRDIMGAADLSPGPTVGLILARLLTEVWADPTRNRREALLARARELAWQHASESGPPVGDGRASGRDSPREVG